MNQEEKQVGWCLIPPPVLSSEDLTNSQKILLGRIVGLATKEGYCYASNKWLGESLDMATSTIQKYIGVLVEKGYVERVVKRDSDQKVKERRLYPKPQGELPPREDKSTTPRENKPTTPSEDKSTTPPRDKSTLRGRYNKGVDKKQGNNNGDPLEITETEGTKSNIYPEDFEEIWDIYPYKRGTKKGGWRKWKARRNDNISNNKLLEAVENYKLEVEANSTEERYVKHCSTFFGPDEHWKEYLDENFDKTDLPMDGLEEAEYAEKILEQI